MHDDDPSPRSLDLVRREVDAAVSEQERRGTAFDSKAGLLLGLGGVLIGLTPGATDTLHFAAHISAALAAASAIAAMLPRTAAGLKLRDVRDRYLMLGPQETKQRMLDTRIWLFEMDEARLTRKVRWIRTSVGFIAIAVASLVAGTTVDFFEGSSL